MKPALQNKSNIVQEIADKIKNSKSTTIIHYHGTTVENLSSLRKQLRNENASLKIYKNNLVKLALKQLKINNLDASLLGPNALVFSIDDEIIAPKILANFAKKNKNLILKSAIFDGKVILGDELQEIATLPSKEGLISMFASAIISPLIKIALVLKEIANKKVEQ